ncbi:MAG: hypothetical protein MJ068_03125 [Clostridia bacterium]|nr:hypothetical protein [Clostridia bacterium]
MIAIREDGKIYIGYSVRAPFNGLSEKDMFLNMPIHKIHGKKNMYAFFNRCERAENMLRCESKIFNIELKDEVVMGPFYHEFYKYLKQYVNPEKGAGWENVMILADGENAYMFDREMVVQKLDNYLVTRKEKTIKAYLDINEDKPAEERIIGAYREVNKIGNVFPLIIYNLTDGTKKIIRK